MFCCGVSIQNTDITPANSYYYIWHPITNTLCPLNCWYDFFLFPFLLYHILTMSRCYIYTLDFTQLVELLRRLSGPSQDHLNTEQRKHIITHTPNIHALSGIRTPDHSVRTREDSSCSATVTGCTKNAVPNSWFSFPFPYKNLYSPAGSVPPKPYLTFYNPTKCTLYFDLSFANCHEWTCPSQTSDIPGTKSHVQFP
jgi:hypothetical protein